MSLTEISVEREAEKRFHTFQWPYRKYSVLVKLFRWRSSESRICSCLSSSAFPDLPKEGRADIFLNEGVWDGWMQFAFWGKCVSILHFEAEVFSFSLESIWVTYPGKDQCWPCWCSSNVTSVSWASAGASPVAYHRLLAPLLRSHRERKHMPVSERALQHRSFQIRPDLLTGQYSSHLFAKE